MIRRRWFWVALPIAVVFALWAGSGLSADDVPQVTEPAQLERALHPAHGAAPATPLREPECLTPADPGPDGDG